jgi:hypothetical protein
MVKHYFISLLNREWPIFNGRNISCIVKWSYDHSQLCRNFTSQFLCYLILLFIYQTCCLNLNMSLCYAYKRLFTELLHDAESVVNV